MFGFSVVPWKYLFGGSAVAALALAGSTYYFKHDRDVLLGWQDSIVTAVRSASENPKVTKKNAAEQILALGDSHKKLKIDLEKQNKTIKDMMAEALALKKDKAELQKLVDKAKAQRRSVIKELEKGISTPGQRDDCEALLKEANDALDLAIEAGL